MKPRVSDVKTITAQVLYDLREATGFCAGTDLHRFFEVMTGNPSPAGNVKISRYAAQNFYAAAVAVRVEHGCKATDFPATL